MKTKSIFLLTFLLVSCLASAQSYIPLQQHMQGVSGAEKITNLAEVEADLGRFTNLSATTGILSTANAQTLNVTGNATVNGFNYTASPTLNGASSTESTSTSVFGGIYNGDFGEGEGFSSTSSSFVHFPGWMGRMGFGVTGSFSVYNGVLNLNATTSGAGRYIEIISVNNESGNISYYPMLPSTTYKLSMRYKTTGIVPDGTADGLSFSITQQNSSGVDLVTSRLGIYTAATDWTTVSTTFTSNSLTTRFHARALLYEATGEAWIDDIKLEQVTTHTNNSTTPTVAYPVITGVSSEFVDQQNTTGSLYFPVGTFSDGNIAIQGQSYIASKSKESAISFYYNGKTGTPLGNLIIEKRADNSNSPSSTVIASVDVEQSILNSWIVGEKTIPLFSISTVGTKYWIIFRLDYTNATSNYYRIKVNGPSDAYSLGDRVVSLDSGSTWTLSSGYDLYFKTHYTENTRQITLTNSSTGTSTTVDWGDDGLPDGAVVDLYNGTMSWDSGSLIQNNNQLVNSNFGKLFSMLYDYETNPYYNSLYPRYLDNCGFDPYGLFSYTSGTEDSYLYFKIPGKYIKDATISFYAFNVASGYRQYANIDYSYDGSNWIEVQTNTYTGGWTTHTFYVKSFEKDIYIRYWSPLSLGLTRMYFTATLDTSAIAPLLLAAGSNTITQSVNGGSYKANVAIKSVSGGFQTTLNEANKQLTVLRNAPRSYLETPDKTTNAIVVGNDELVSISGPVQVNGATIMNASTTPAYDIALPYNSGGAIGSSWNTYSETKYKNIISDVTEASYASIASRLAGVQSKMVTRKIPDAVKAKFFDAEIEWVTDVVSVTEELKTQVVEPVYEVVKLDSKVVLDSKTTEEQLLTAEADRKIVSYATKEVSVLRSPGEYPRQEFRGWKVRQGVDEATKKQLENLYFKPHPEPIADTAPEAYRVPEGFAWSKWVEESTIYQNWILPQIINELPKLRKRLEALEASK